MNKVRIRRRRKQRLQANHWQTVALMTELGVAIAIIIWATYCLMIQPTTILYGENPNSDRDDMECITIGNDIMNTTATICCEMHPIVGTTYLNTNFSFDTTPCIKLDNKYFDI